MIAAPATRGYAPMYEAEVRCPGCGRRNWLIGRVSAECACCATVLPLVHPDAQRR